MTAKRILNDRKKAIEQMHKLAVRLYINSKTCEDLAVKADSSQDQKLWWGVRMSVAEAVNLLAHAKKRPEPTRQAKAEVKELDHLGIPRKEGVDIDGNKL